MSSVNLFRRSRLATNRQRRGIIIVLTAFMLIVLISMIAFALDVGYLVHTDTELQRAVDAGALAGAGVIIQGADMARQSVKDYIKENLVNSDVIEDTEIEIEVGHWNEETQTLIPTEELPSAVRVVARRPNQPFFFAHVIGTDSFTIEAEAVAMFRPREIVLVLDYSASMSDDSEFDHISQMGQSTIEANMLQIYGELGSPTFGNMQWTPQYISSTNSSTISNTLGLNGVPYPYPGGSWSNFFSYVQNDSSVNSAGYRRRYGYMTWISYLLDVQTMYEDTPDLWKTSEQPITALKNAVTVFLAYLEEVETDDRLGLAIYTAADGTGLIESNLTADFASIETKSRQRQAAHYHRSTNIGAGLKKAREELQANSRLGAFKMIVLMTDGIANLPGSTSNARNYVLSEAQLCANAKYPVVTISLGAGADTALMQSVADMTGGVHFNVPGGQTIEEVEEDLKDIFREIADGRPLRLLK